MSQPVICPHCQSPVVDTSGFASGPITCPACAESIEQAMVACQSPEWVAERMQAHANRAPQGAPKRAPADSGQAAKEIQTVMDVVTGPNLRWKDNVLQAIAIAVCTVLGVPIGALVAHFIRADLIAGLLLGGFGGLLFGLFASGIVIMVYRMFRH